MVAIADENQWSTNGPDNCRVQTIAIHPSNNQIIYIGTVENGIYKTTNGGENWVHMDSDILPVTLRVIAIHPTGPDTMYAATVLGLYKSIDAGETWIVVQLPCGWQFEVVAFAIHPTLPNIMFVNGPLFEGINYRTTDGGQTWLELDLPPLQAYKFAIDPINQNLIYTISHSGRYRKSIFKSEDYGETWANIHNNLDTTTIAKAFAIDPVNTNILYIGGSDFYEEATGRCLHKSTDGGNNWNDITPGVLHQNYVKNILVSPLDNNIVYICTVADGVLKSEDGGLSWEEKNEGLTISLIKNIVYDTLSNYFYLGTYWDGIYRSIDDCESWGKISDNIPNTDCIDYTIDINTPDDQIICTHNGLYRTCDGTLNWEHIDILYPDYNALPRCALIDRYDSDIIVVGLKPLYWSTDPVYIIRSGDGGTSWEPIDEGFPSYLGCRKIKQANYDNRQRRYYLAAYSGLYISEDAGLHWSPAGNGLPEERFFTMDVSEADPDYVFVGCYYLFRTINGGETWDQLSMPPGSYVEDIVCDPFNPNIVYLSIILGRIYKSWDAGQTWNDITNNLPYDYNYMRFSGVAVNPLNPENIYISSHHYGIFQSHNGGDSWEPFSEGLNTEYSGGITIIDPTDTNRIYLATDQQSCWSITRTTSSIDDDITLPGAFSVSNYPNPFNASTTIRYNLSEPSYVTIDIYDVLGRKVEMLVEQYQQAGCHKVSWNADDNTSGIYFYKIQAGNHSESKKMVLLK